jgi:hypothetical protein
VSLQTEFKDDRSLRQTGRDHDDLLVDRNCFCDRNNPTIRRFDTDRPLSSSRFS